MSVVGVRVVGMTEPMRRKDGRELVTEFPVTAMDQIDVVLDAPALDPEGLVCIMRRRPVDESWTEPDEGPGDDFDIGEWDA
jgi:hypothetical protein